MADFSPSSPEKEEVSLFLPAANRGTGLEITKFTEYSFHSNLLSPGDDWSFTLGGSNLPTIYGEALKPGTPVKLILNGGVQASGYVDSIEKRASRDGGTTWHVMGRDRLGQAQDACANPTVSLKESMTLLEGMKTLFAPFGWSEDKQFIESNDANRQLKAGGLGRSKTKKSDAKGFGRRAIKAYKLHQYRPYAKESVFEFASRITQRFGLWIWTTASGEELVLSEPDFDIDPFYKIFRTTTGEGTNVLAGAVKLSMANQPTHIVADSYSKGGEFSRGRVKVIMPNTAVRIQDANSDDVESIPELQKYIEGGAVIVPGPAFPASSSLVVPKARILYLHDDESQTLEHLQNFVRREMALLQRQSLTVSYTVEGHGQITDDGFIPWTVDTTVDVEDEVGGVTERLYILGRTFNKSRESGTTTDLELIRLNTLSFSDTGK